MTLDKNKIPSIMEIFIDKMGSVSSYFISISILLLINLLGYIGYSIPSLYLFIGFSLASFQLFMLFCIIMTLLLFAISLANTTMFNENMSSILKLCIKLKRENKSLKKYFLSIFLGSFIIGLFTYATYVQMYFSYGYVVYPIFGILSSVAAWLYFYLTYKFIAKVYNSQSLYESLKINFNIDPDDFDTMDEYLKYCNKMTENN
jgi:hypothetical protein